MTNRQKQIGKFASNRSEQPKYNPNWWISLPSTHPLHDATPTRQQRRAAERKSPRAAHAAPLNIGERGPNRFERRRAASGVLNAARKARKASR